MPSLRIVIRCEAIAEATKSLSTRSRRRRSLIPHAVGKRRLVTGERFVRELLEPLLCEPFRARVGSERPGGRLLGRDRVLGDAVDAAARRKDEAAGAGLFASWARWSVASWLTLSVTSS